MKRYFSLLLALGAMLACCVFASAEETACSPWAELYLSDAEQVYDIIPGELQGCHWQAPITRQEAAAFLFRAAEYCGLQTFSCDLPFSDSDEIAPWAAEAAGHICAMGVMNGMGNGTFAPGALYTWEQAVATAIRLMESYPYLNSREDFGQRPQLPLQFHAPLGGR